MALKLNRELLPVKAHFFFFFAALGPILPQLNVFGKQLGVTAVVMGMVTAVLPLLWAAAKPLFGYLVDYFTNQRKFIFMMLIGVMTSSYCCLWFIPVPHKPHQLVEYVYTYHLNSSVYVKQFNQSENVKSDVHRYNCQWNCLNRTAMSLWLPNTTYVNTLYVEKFITENSCEDIYMDNSVFNNDVLMCSPKSNCDLVCILANVTEKGDGSKERRDGISLKEGDLGWNGSNGYMKINADALHVRSEATSFYSSSTFWGFVILMCLGTVAFNVANCIGDAVCFDVLGPERGNRYGSQRAWGTAGYGITALLGGWLVDASSCDGPKDFAPAFLLALVFTLLDLAVCHRLKLPRLRSPSDAGRALRAVLRLPRVVVFIVFAVVAGIFDSFIIYYMFWYLEELAEVTGYMAKIKLIEGVVVAGQSFVGELLFFMLSGKILKRWGHGVTMTLCLFCYGVRLALISLITHPWHLVFIECIMQGPTYALCYATIVGYAAEVAPEGYSATVQGIVAGMDDGVGFALGSLLGGVIYSYLGGCNAFRLMALVGLLAAFTHALLHRVVSGEGGAAQKSNIDKATPEEGEKMMNENQDAGNAIYRDTVVSLAIDKKGRGKTDDKNNQI